jgi:predicted ATPase with chaperone activity
MPLRAMKGSKSHLRMAGQVGSSSSPADKVEKRRQQNRNSQIAFRKRTKMTLKMLQEELNQSLEANEALYDTVEELLEKTEILKRTIEDVLALRLKRSFSSPRSSSCLAFN